MDIGVDYYPEHWDRKDWDTHARLMEEAGLKVVRLAEFAWSRMEPKEGKYDFGWLDDAITVLRKRNMKIILGTPTAAPPPWLVTRHPETLVASQDGVRTEAGGRRHYCYTSPAFREYTRKIVTAMAAHYADNPAVAGWQTDNEIGGPMCWCDACAEAFQGWLKSRYQTLDRLNAEWGTVFWGQEYADWGEIPLPRTRHASHSPSIVLDHKRFHSANVVSHHDLQVGILRKVCPRHFVTHNLMGFYDEVDYFQLVKGLDIAAHDNYPGNLWGCGKDFGAPLDYIRSLKHKPFMVMEQRSGLTGWLTMFNSGDQPGQLRLWTYQAVAHGADSVVFFRWRTSRFGIEQYWHGILDHHGQPGRRYREVQRMGREFAALGDRVPGSTYTAPVGVLINPEARWALDIQKGSPDLDFKAHMGGYTSAFAWLNAGVEYYGPADDISGAKVLIAPTLFLLDQPIASKLAQYAENGGILVLTMRSGVKDTANVVVNERLPGLLKSLTGCEVEEYDALVDKEAWKTDLLKPLPGRTVKASVWCDQLKLTGAKPLARYAEGPFKGSPAASINRVGKGTVIYVGFRGDEEFNRTLAKWLLTQSGVPTPFAPSAEVEVTERVKGKERFVFILNHSAKQQSVKLPGKGVYRDLLTGQKPGRTVTLKPWDVRILSPVTGA
jgi:beta-galactosidase